MICPLGGISGTVFFYGDFYELLPDQIRCRSTLEIVRTRRVDAELANLSREGPDLVVIMANPGASAPRDGHWLPRQPAQIGELADLREMEHERTQTKIEQLMEFRQYDHVRVLNLSDIVQPSLKRLAQQLREREGNVGDSLFASPQRAEELDVRLNPRSNTVVAAWSYEDAQAFTDRGGAAYETVVQRGLRVIGVEGRFAHPSRSGTWAEDMHQMLRDDD